MTFNPNAKINGSKVTRRGRNTGLAVGGGGIGVLLLVLLGPLFGVDLTGLMGDSGGTNTSLPGASESFQQCRTGADANKNLDCRMAGAALSIDAYWASDSSVRGYHSPQFKLFTGSTTTGCGVASSATGPFYCPTDESIYLDTGFFDELRNRFGASGGPLAQMYVVAHEWGHHVQNISGIMDGLDLRDTGPASDSVRLELQADCFAGAWAGSASTVPDESGTPFLEPITRQQVADALNAASAIGDDRIQQKSNGQVNSESWTHGSSAQRQHWFETGFTDGSDACTTFQGQP